MEESLRHFYRYRALNNETALNYLEQTIRSNELFFPKASSFNDPFDCRPVFSFDSNEEEMKRYLKRVTAKNMRGANRLERRSQESGALRRFQETKARKRLIQTNLHHITEKVGILCLSELADDILMWSHYADSHRGVCLEFDAQSDFFARAQSVKYQLDRPILNPILDSPARMAVSALLTKAEHWAYEKEWRIVEYEKGPGVYHFPPSALTGIIFGSQISETLVSTISSWVTKRPHELKLRRASIDPVAYSIQIG